MSHTETIEKDGRKLTITNEIGPKTRNGRAAIYQNHTEKSAVDAKIKGIDMTTELTTAYETGIYGGNINPTAYATVPVKEFDWGVNTGDLVQKVAISTGVVVAAATIVWLAPIIGAWATGTAVTTAVATMFLSVFDDGQSKGGS